MCKSELVFIFFLSEPGRGKNILEVIAAGYVFKAGTWLPPVEIVYQYQSTRAGTVHTAGRPLKNFDDGKIVLCQLVEISITTGVCQGNVIPVNFYISYTKRRTKRAAPDIDTVTARGSFFHTYSGNSIKCINK